MEDHSETLDPADWDALRALARRIVNDAADYTRDVRDRPVWALLQNSPLMQGYPFPTNLMPRA
jgi:hypothetical protein